MTDRTVAYEFGEFRLDPVSRLFTRQHQPIAVAPKSFDLLMLLVERRGRVVERGELISELWPDTIVEEANVTFQVSTLRKALGEVTTYICRNFTCQAPLVGLKALVEHMS